MKKARGAFGKPKWQRAPKEKPEPVKIEIPSEPEAPKRSWWDRLGHNIWGRS